MTPPRTRKMQGKPKRLLSLYAIIYERVPGSRFHSIDYSKVWHTREAAREYLKTIPAIVRKDYGVFRFVEAGRAQKSR